MIYRIEQDWKDKFKGLIQRERNRIKKHRQLVPADDGNFMCGITDYEEASTWAIIKNCQNQTRYAEEVYSIVNSLYAQFFHQMASQIEAITVYVLSKNGKNVELLTGTLSMIMRESKALRVILKFINIMINYIVFGIL